MTNKPQDRAALEAEAARGSAYGDLAQRYGSLVGEAEMLTESAADQLISAMELLGNIEEELTNLPHRWEKPNWLNEWWEQSELGLDKWYDGLRQQHDKLLKRSNELPAKQKPKLAKLDRERAELKRTWGNEPPLHRGSIEKQIGDLPTARTALKTKLDEVKRKLDEVKRKLDELKAKIEAQRELDKAKYERARIQRELDEAKGKLN